MVFANAARWSRGSVIDWAAEAHQIAVTVVYGKLAVAPGYGQHRPVETISPAYVAAAAPAVRGQLARAAVRLAAVLNGVDACGFA